MVAVLGKLGSSLRLAELLAEVWGKHGVVEVERYTYSIFVVSRRRMRGRQNSARAYCNTAADADSYFIFLLAAVGAISSAGRILRKRLT